MSIFSEYKTSARLLKDCAVEMWGENLHGQDRSRRLILINDLYIKAFSYALINKVAFWLALIFGMLVLLWPSVAILMKDFYGVENEFLKSAIVQTTVTGIAALTFALYSHYKKQQMRVENLMRYVIYSDDSLNELVDRVMVELGRVDTGFSFSGSLKGFSEAKSSETINLSEKGEGV